MGTISISTWTPAIDPGSITVIRKDKRSAVVETYSGAAYFSWGSSIVGKQIILTWNWMPGDEFAALDALYEADVEVVFDPDDGTSRTFNVNLLGLDGDYLRGLDNTSASIRTNVTLTLCIMSQV